jgi:hypothetical protein
VREIDLRLMTRRRLEADDRLRRRRGTELPDERLQLRVAACVPRSPDLVEQPNGRELRIRGESRVDDGPVCIELRRSRRSGAVAHRVVVEVPIEIAGANPAMDRIAMDTELPRQGALACALLEIVPE